MAGYRQVQVIEATSGASGVTTRGFGMFSEFGGRPRFDANAGVFE
jgi:hypothetical protein